MCNFLRIGGRELGGVQEPGCAGKTSFLGERKQVAEDWRRCGLLRETRLSNKHPFLSPSDSPSPQCCWITGFSTNNQILWISCIWNMMFLLASPTESIPFCNSTMCVFFACLHNEWWGNDEIWYCAHFWSVWGVELFLKRLKPEGPKSA